MKIFNITLPIAFIINILLGSSAIAQVPTDKEAKKYFENLSLEERAKYLNQGTVLNVGWNPNIQNVDILKEFSETCKIPYVRDDKGVALLPLVQCDYKPAAKDDPLSGSSPKFNCLFDWDNKNKEHKVKYSLEKVDKKEIPQGVILASMARLMGFYSNTNCPMRIACRGCPNDPWESKSEAPGDPKSQVVFQNAIVEFSVKGSRISRPKTEKDLKPLGFDWAEMKNATRDELIAREALMVFINMVHHGDADPHNHKLVCQEWIPENGKPICTKPVAFVHDWGVGFRKMDYRRYARYTPISSWGCKANLELEHFYIGTGLKYSREAIDFLIARLDKITDQQLTDLLELSQVRKMGQSPNDWIELIRDQVESIRKIDCPAFDSGKTALSKN